MLTTEYITAIHGFLHLFQKIITNMFQNKSHNPKQLTDYQDIFQRNHCMHVRLDMYASMHGYGPMFGNARMPMHLWPCMYIFMHLSMHLGKQKKLKRKHQSR